MWEELLNSTLSTNWQLSPFTEATTFKLKHTLNNYVDAIGMIALVNDSVNPVEILEPRKIIPRHEAEIIKFSKIYGWKYKLAVKQILLPNKPLVSWSINIFASNVKETSSVSKETSADLRLKPQFTNPKHLLLITCI